jgi:hypothetical protein
MVGLYFLLKYPDEVDQWSCSLPIMALSKLIAQTGLLVCLQLVAGIRLAAIEQG